MREVLCAIELLAFTKDDIEKFQSLGSKLVTIDAINDKA